MRYLWTRGPNWFQLRLWREQDTYLCLLLLWRA